MAKPLITANPQHAIGHRGGHVWYRGRWATWVRGDVMRVDRSGSVASTERGYVYLGVRLTADGPRIGGRLTTTRQLPKGSRADGGANQNMVQLRPSAGRR